MPIHVGTILSGSTNGKALAVVATTSPGTTIHTVSSATTGVVEDVYIDAFSQATTDRVLTMENGGTATAFRSEHLIPAQGGPIRIYSGIRFTSATGIVIAAFATATGGLLVAGGVNRATP